MTRAGTIMLLTGLLVSGCGKMPEPEMTSNTTNEEFDAHRMFAYEDCKVYRFRDRSREHYLFNCDKETYLIAEYQTSCGKNCVKIIQKNVNTIYPKR